MRQEDRCKTGAEMEEEVKCFLREKQKMTWRAKGQEARV